VTIPTEWFCALLDTATDVYFRYSLVPPRGFAYVSPSIQALTGHTPTEFYADRDLCLTLVASADRRLLRRVLRSQRGVTLKLHLVRHGVAIPVEVRTVALVKHRRVVAIEGVVTLAVPREADAGRAAAVGRTFQVRRSARDGPHADDGEPVQQRLAALMYEVHDLLHRVLPPSGRSGAVEGSKLLRLGDLALDTDRLTVTESGESVSLTSREVLVLRYLLERGGRVVTRRQLLTDVWSYSYTGDDRTVDVHISRLRRKLPSLRSRLTAIRNIGYRLEIETDIRIANC
jgi:DNA-binding winged helix-turn-helix (wHTH) protein